MQSKCLLLVFVIILFVLVVFNPFKGRFRYEESDRSEPQKQIVIVGEHVSWQLFQQDT